MLFSVRQAGPFSPGLVWEYGRVLGRSRRKTLHENLILVTAAYILFMGIVFTVGMLASIGEPLTEREELGLLAMVPLIPALLLWGMSWCGFSRLPAALARLLRGRQSPEDSRFYPNHITRFRDSAYTDYPYQAVRDVYEGRTAFFLLMEGGQLLLLLKSGFIQGEPGAFRRFMDEKCGKPVIKV